MKTRRRSQDAAAAGSPAESDKDAALTAFRVAWEALERTLPAYARVRMEGVDPAALPLTQAAWLAVGYPLKWGTTSFQVPAVVRMLQLTYRTVVTHTTQVASHFQAHSAALRALAACPRDPTPTLLLGLAGDCMWMRDSWSGWASPETQRLLDSCDAVVANLETPLHEHSPSDPLWRLQALLPDMVTYSSPVSFLQAFTRPEGSSATAPLMGAFSVANNHSADMGPLGARCTLAALDAAGMAHSGIRLDGAGETWCSFERACSSGRGSGRGQPAPVVRVGFYAATFGVNFPDKAAACAAAQARASRTSRSLRWRVHQLAGHPKTQVSIQTLHGITHPGAAIDLREAEAALKAMCAAGCTFRIVSIHWGHEFEGYPTMIQMEVARALVRAGADLVLGAHAHVAQPAEVLLLNGFLGGCEQERAALERVPEASRLCGVAGPPRKALVLYGMGNFCSTMFNELCRVGLLQTLQLRPAAGATSPAGPPCDWHLPAWHWLYNEAAVLRGAAMASKPRRLVHIVSDGSGCAGRGASADTQAHAICPRKRRLVDFMRAHVLGGDPFSGEHSGGEVWETRTPPAFWL